MKKFAVIGDPIHHSLSPTFQNAMLQSLGIDAHYDKILVPAASLNEWMKSDEAMNLSGFNVTMPLKKDIIPNLYEISPEARKVNAVNTVVRKNDKLFGYTTDGIGLIRSIESAGVNPQGNIAILGSGGAALAVAHALKDIGSTVSIYCRNKNNSSLDTSFNLYDFSEINSLSHYDILINATPLGMYNHGQFDNFDFLKNINKNTLICDLIYKPLETELLKQAKALNLKTINGLGMLIHQGIAALELFLDLKLDRIEMEKIAKKAIMPFI